ncbi:hypothetical protein HZB58_05445 [Candidatus Gottesmanbacteria bacterium]|nr:hypothetical protein [Candidatus Gottesmanbacteria bacterium]
MTATAHALVSGAIAARFTDPVTASLLALASHYIMDSIPHWDFGTNWRNRPKHTTGIFAIGETLTGIGLSYFFFGQYLPFMLWAITVLFGILPDWLETPWYIFYANAKKQSPGAHAGILEKVSYAFYKLPNIFHSKAQLPLGLVTQIATVIFFLVILA